MLNEMRYTSKYYLLQSMAFLDSIFIAFFAYFQNQV